MHLPYILSIQSIHICRKYKDKYKIKDKSKVPNDFEKEIVKNFLYTFSSTEKRKAYTRPSKIRRSIVPQRIMRLRPCMETYTETHTRRPVRRNDENIKTIVRHM